MAKKGKKHHRKKLPDHRFHWWILGGFVVLFLLASIIAHRNAGQVKGVATVNPAYITVKNRSFWDVITGIFSRSTDDTVTPTPAGSTGLPALGDGKAVYTGPKKGYIYLCHSMNGTGGAFQDGPWIQGSYWDPAKKFSVDGSVSWKNAKATFTVSGNSRIITSNDLPQKHTTGVYPIASTDDAYQYDKNPNKIKEQSLSVTLPKDPHAAASPTCMGGEVGIALTGIAIFNGFDATLRDAVAHEIQDTYGGHPQEKGEYHYHNIPKLVQALLPSTGGMTLVGYAYDGYGIYGSVENGKKLTNDDLDECHGHSHQIVWDGKTVTMYHYHATDEFPYTVGCFHGTSTFKGPTGGQTSGMPGQQQGFGQGGMMQGGGQNSQQMRPGFPPQGDGNHMPPPGMPIQ